MLQTHLEQVEKILQEEIADRAIYQDRYAEETLIRGLQSSQSRLEVLLTSFAEALSKEVETMKNSKEHICRFNDGEQNCECHNSTLSDIQALLKK